MYHFLEFLFVLSSVVKNEHCRDCKIVMLLKILLFFVGLLSSVSAFTSQKSSHFYNHFSHQLHAFGPEDIPPAVYVGLAAAIGVGAGALQSKMFGGDRGLGSFLSDGKGYKNSAYKMPRRGGSKPDPGWLRGLRLPDLDFVEVYGYDDEDDGDDSEIAIDYNEKKATAARNGRGSN